MRRSAFALSLVLLALAVQARADDVGIARTRFREGVAYFDKGQYDLARAAFLEAWALKKHPAILTNLAESCLKGHRWAEAARYFQQLLARSDVELDARAEAQKALAEARTHDARLEIRGPTGEVFVDGGSVGVTPLRGAVDVDPGAHTVKSSAPGTTERHVTVAAGEDLVVDLAAAAPRPPTKTAPPPPPTTPPPSRPVAAPSEATLGGEGESCRARADCRRGLLCVSHVCTDESIGRSCETPDDCGGTLVCAAGRCGRRAASSSGTFDASGVHPFVGAAVRGGPAWAVVTGSSGGNDQNLEGSFVFALRAGVLMGNHELAVEIAPFTDQPYRNLPPVTNGTAFQAVATYGYLVPLFQNGALSVSWPLRIGAGIMAGGNNTDGLAYFVARADLVGIAARIGHLVLSVELPSFSYAVTSTSIFGSTFQLHLLAWQGGLTAGYAF